ncbi:MAG: MutH/Sau3AI family endonuclease, partial [Myxococcota bacterium]
PHLGVELKSIPCDLRGHPSESTYVCTAPLAPGALGGWADAWVRRKLSRVLWLPLVPAGADRVVGSPVVWSPSPDEEAVLRADFEELVTLLADGAVWQIDGRRGQALHLRPKAADGEPAAWAVDEDAGWVRQTARGFYLRPSFTLAILSRHLLLPE